MSSILVTLLDRARRLLAWRWLPVIVNTAVLVLVVLAVGNQAWALFGRAAPSASSVSPPRGVQVAIDPLMGHQLFGISRRGGPGGSAPLSSLNVALAGVIPTLDGGFALISVNSQPQETYSVGQEIVPGTVLRKVQVDRVLVERNGLTETLMLQEANAATDTATGPVPGSAAATQGTSAAAPAAAPVQPAAVRAPSAADQARLSREERRLQREERRKQRARGN